MSWRIAVIFALALTVFPMPSADGQELCRECPVLEEGAFLERVVRANPEVRSLRLEGDRAAARLQEARGAFDPALTSGYEYKTKDGLGKLNVLRTGLDVPLTLPASPSVIVDYRRGLGTSIDPSVATARDGETSFGLAFEPLSGLFLDEKQAKLDKAKLEPRRADAEQAEKRNRLLLEATQDYWKWVEARRTLEVKRNQLEIATRRFDLVTRRAGTGEAAPIDTAEAKLAVVSRRESVAAAERKAEATAVKLATYLWTTEGEPADFRFRPPETVPLPEVDSAAIAAADSLAVARRPELRRLDVKRRQTRIEQRLAREQLRPDVKLKAQLVSYENGPLDVSDVKVGFEINQPLFFRGGRSEAEQARLDVQQLDFKRDVTERKVRADVEEAVIALRQARRRVEAAEEQVALARQLLEAERRRFELGESTLFLLTKREQAFAKARTSLVSARIDVHRATARLRWATGEIAQRVMSE